MNEIIEYREKPLTEVEFQKLSSVADKYFLFKPKLVGKRVPKRCEDGEIYGWEHDLVESGYEIITKGEPPLKLIESIKRPATKEAIRRHLYTLSIMKRYTGGDVGFSVIVHELEKRLTNCSEYALMKICEDLAMDTRSQFFPDPAVIVANVVSFQNQLEIQSSPYPKYKNESSDDLEKQFIYRPSIKQKIRVARLAKLAVKPKGIWTKWENKFWDAMGEKIGKKV